MKPNASAGIIYGLRVIPAIGGGFLFQVPLFAVQSTTIDDDIGIATSTVTFFRSVGQAFGVAIGGTVFQNQFDRFVARRLLDGSIPRQYVVTGAEAAGAYSVIATFPEEVIRSYRYIYADALRVVWYVTTGISGLGLVASLWVRNESMDRGSNAKQSFRDKREERKREVV